MKIINGQRGLNFNVSKYEVLSNNTFIPYIRSDERAAIPHEILKHFILEKNESLVAIIKITSKKDSFFRIKKLSKSGNSLVMTMISEKKLKDILVEIIDIKNEIELMKRSCISKDKKIRATSILPSHTLGCSFPCEKMKKVCPIFVFDLGDECLVGTYFGRKDVKIRKNIELNEHICVAIGLYFAEGGKIASTFTNCQPKMINIFLDFLESISDFDRNSLNVSINCSSIMKSNKKELESFWSQTTAIGRFRDKLHIGKHVKSPQGILDLNFGSLVLKELICGLIRAIQELKVDKMAVIRGILSGDGSPILQHTNYITHHIATDKKYFDFQKKILNYLFEGTNLRVVNKGKIVLYNSWKENLDFLYKDSYKYNIFNREKFARIFLNLPSTKLLLGLENGQILKGTDISSRNLMKAFEKRGEVMLKQISPKPNRTYKIFLTKKGLEQKRRVEYFKYMVYPKYQYEIHAFKKLLSRFGLLEEEFKAKHVQKSVKDFF